MLRRCASSVTNSWCFSSVTFVCQLDIDVFCCGKITSHFYLNLCKTINHLRKKRTKTSSHRSASLKSILNTTKSPTPLSTLSLLEERSTRRFQHFLQTSKKIALSEHMVQVDKMKKTWQSKYKLPHKSKNNQRKRKNCIPPPSETHTLLQNTKNWTSLLWEKRFDAKTCSLLFFFNL